MWTLFLLLLVGVVGSRSDRSDSDTNTNSLRGQRDNNQNQLQRRDSRTFTFVQGDNDTSFVSNVTALVHHVDRNCPLYCQEQMQYNGVCVRRGCGGWRTALKEGCSTLCSGGEGSYKESYSCQLGCSRAIEDYYFRLTSLLGVADPPTLISGTLKSTSLRLSWEGQQGLPYLTFSIERRTSNNLNGGGIWETVGQTAMNSSQLSVINLKPYSQYQFRIGFVLAVDFPPFYSRESNPILTLSQGLPSPPQITSIQPISNTSVAITWLPPLQPNGRLIAVILKLQRVPNGHAIIKEIPVSQNPRGYTFSGLVPLTNYSLAVSAQNLEGEGDANNIHFVTPQSPISNEVSKSPEPRLLVQGLHSVYLQHLDLLMEPDAPLFMSPHNITGVAVHMQQKWLFIATSSGEILRTGLYHNSTVVIVPASRLDLSVAFLSVDWLHNRLYILGKKRRSSIWVIKRCDLQGSSLLTIYPHLSLKPLDFFADPFTGYLYWVTPPTFNSRGGLYKLDLVPDSFTSSPVPQPVMEGSDLGPFTVDVKNYRILIVDKGRNTVLSVSLDGDIVDIRGNTQSPQFGDANSLQLYQGLLYWSTQGSVVGEEYNSVEDSYYQNRFDVPKLRQPLKGLLVVHPDVQPTPVPLAPPRELEVLYGQWGARVTWQPPPSISALGDGAWREWKYQLRISDNRTISNISSTSFLLSALRPSTAYSVQVLAYSPTGKGPSSSPNRGKTLRETPYNITLLWASLSGLYSTNTLGDNVQLLTASPSPLEVKGLLPSDLSMSSLTWWDNAVFFALTNGSVFHYSSPRDDKPLKEGAGALSLVRGIAYAQSIAFDYIGQRLYWSNPKQQTILRCAVSSTSSTGCAQRERLQLVTMAREIAVDSYKGLLLWSTGHSLEMSRMNGYSHGTLFQQGLFSGKVIMGMTLDTDQSRIYWITRSASGSTLQRLSYNIRGAQLPMVIANYEDTSIQGPIRYFNDRLLWLQSSSEVIVTDLNGHGKSSLKLNTIANITNVHVKDQGSLRYPGGFALGRRVEVTPDPVLKWSVVISGRWDNFTIAWLPVNNTNYGKVLYEVTLNNSLSRITAQPNITVENGTLFVPYSEVEVSITSLTYWANAKPTLARLKTPSWKPSEPLNPRVYIEHLSYPYVPRNESGVLIRAELRWDAPLNPNGPILGYLVHCWKNESKHQCCEVEVDSTLTCEMALTPQSVYKFSIQAYTSSGAGDFSKKIVVDTGYPSPLPRLLLTTSDRLEILDIDRNTLAPIQLGYLSPLSSSFMAVDKEVFWLNEGGDLMRARVDSPSYNKSRLLSLTALRLRDSGHLALDWVGRKLYWTCELSQESGSEFKYGILTFDLSALEGSEGQAEVVVTSKTQIRSVAVNPFKSALYWTTSKRNGATTLYTGDSRDNFTSRPFLSRDLERCNCTLLTRTGDPVTFDPTGLGEVKRGILFLDGGSVWMADELGCSCYPLVNTTRASSRHNQQSAFNIGGDSKHIYFAGGGGYLAASIKDFKQTPSFTELLPSTSGIRELHPFGSSAQPYPPYNCLIPRKMDPERPLLFNHSAHSLHLNLPLGVTSLDCPQEFSELSLPTPHYSVYYGTVDQAPLAKCTPSSPTHCKVIRTLDKSLHITDLHPYTTYTVFVTLTNHYSLRQGLAPLVCEPIMLRTAPGAPMPPKLLRVEPLTPMSLRVVWGQPEKLNGEKVWYEVHWKVSGSGSSSKHQGQKWAETESRSNHNRTEFYLDLVDLLPNSNYTLWVSAYSEKGDAFSDSLKQTLMTFPHPNNITVTRATPHDLSVLWVPPNDTTILRHQVIYRDGWSSVWNVTPLVDFTVPSRPYHLHIPHLKPKTLYGFRIRTWYIGDPLTPYVWPWEGQFDFETLADKPSRPSVPIARGIGKALYEVSWERAEENGAMIQEYALEYRFHALPQTEDYGNATTSAITIVNIGSTTELTSGEGQRSRREVKLEGVQKLVSTEKRRVDGLQWNLAYNGTGNRWEVEGLEVDGHYRFRVRAKNLYGWGEYSDESGVISLADLTLVAEPQSVGLIILVILSASLILSAFAVLFICLYRRKQKEKPALISGSERREVELATLRELPGGSSFTHQSNILYSSSSIELLLDLELSGVQKVSWQQISVTQFLGSGAFGEVYEGIASLASSVAVEETRVAIKTLRKGSNPGEKVGFIQEAKLMAQFRHPHIIQLLGVCVDADCCYLLLELMGGGDLLSYLRSNRPNLGIPTTQLNLVDLIRMCVDVAKGCVYLEEMHFVHRDLAARNCLVSLGELEGTLEGPRVVKIGDFGLARDIYRNDYYRKDGEGLLPVRWMAPESLVDGIFTTQTDVWAFGVLLWEIMTLGQQPYPARNNVEVLNYVRGGGRLQRPPHCPHVLGNLMLGCWEYNPENRPSFKDCLNQLELILRDFRDLSLAPLPPLNDINFDPYSYSDGGSETKSQYGSQFRAHPEDSPDSVFLPGSSELHFPRHFPKYLEVLSDSSQSPYPSCTDEGYEIPLPKKPPRAPHNQRVPSTLEIGLPSPSYWNWEGQHQQRGLLRSSTSEDVEEGQGQCGVREHHYLSNVGGSDVRGHLRGVPCPYTQNPSLFNNHAYAAQSLNNSGSIGGNFSHSLHSANSA